MTGPLAQQFAQVREGLAKSWRSPASDETDAALAALSSIERHVQEAKERLTWISDPTYVGNYSPEEVVEIHRKWAKDGLAALSVPAEEEK